MSNHVPSEFPIQIESDDDNTTSISRFSTPPPPPPQQLPPERCGAVTNCILKFIWFLRKDNEGKGAEADALRRDEADAYRKLVSDLEAELRWVKPSFVKEVAFHALTFVALVALVAAAGSIVHHGDHAPSRWRVFHLKIDRWVGLLFVAVSGLPCIRLATFVASEPLVWWRKMNKYAFFFARRLKRSVDVTLWFTLLLWVWYSWFPSEILKDTRGGIAMHIPPKEYKNTLKMVTRQVTSLLMALAIGALLWTLKDILYLKLKAELFFDDICDRIRRTLLDLHAIQFIIEKGKWSFIESCKSKSGSGDNAEGGVGVVNGGGGLSKDRSPSALDQPDFCLAVSRLRKESAPTWILERLIDEFMKYMKKNTGKFSDLEATHDDEKFMYVAKDLYKKIISDLEVDTITINDLEKHAHGHGQYRGEFKHVFESYKGDHTNTITRDQFYRWAVLAFKNGLGFARTITGSERIFAKLNVLMSSFVVGLTVVIWLLISRLVTTAEVAILFMPFLSATYVFSDSLKTAFNGIIFVFGMHPYDLGDRVIINDTRMKVIDMMLLTTTFFVYDTGNEIIYPNSDLATKSIINLDATKNMSDSVEFSVPVDTPEELILDLQFKIKKSLDDELTFTSDTMVAKKQINEDNDKVVILVHFKYLVAYHFETKTVAMSKVLKLIMKLRKDMEKVKTMEKDIESKQEQYEAETVKFKIPTKMKMKMIEKLNKNIMGILQNHKSSRNCSKIIFTRIKKEEDKICMEVHIRCFRKQLKSRNEKQSIIKEIESVIEAGGGSVIHKQGNTHG